MKIKVSHQGQVTENGFSVILDLVNVKINTKIESIISGIHATKDKQGHIGKSMTLSSKVNRPGHAIVFNIFDILDLENVRIDTKIDFGIMFETGDKKGHAKKSV